MCLTPRRGCFKRRTLTEILGSLLASHLPLLLAACVSSSPPQFLAGADMVYPPAAKAAAIEGYVIVRYDVTAQGMVVNVKVMEAEPEGVFEDAALASIVQWRFRAATVAGKPVETRGLVSTLRFKLGTGDGHTY